MANGIIDKPGDIDYFKFHAKKGQAFDVHVYAREILRSPLDSVLTITRASNGQGIASNDDTFGPDSYVRFNAPEDDDYLIAVTDQLRAGGPDFVYRVEITEPSAVAHDAAARAAAIRVANVGRAAGRIAWRSWSRRSERISAAICSWR